MPAATLTDEQRVEHTRAVLRRYRMKKRRQLQALVDAAKESEPCLDCGHSFPACCMDFDHVRGVKKRAIANIVSRSGSEAELGREMAKCDLVCACCHRIRTAKRRLTAGKELAILES